MEKLVQAVKVVLGTAFALYLKTHAAHWNVEGQNFPAYHTMFETMYDDIWRSIDAIAEQVRQLDAYAPASLERLIELSRIPSNNDILLPTETLVMLTKDTETMLTTLTEALHLAETADRQGLVNFLAGRIELHSKFRWQLRAAAKRFQ